MAAIALLSDVHANLQALQAVLAHIDEQGEASRIYCLGDVVGYGPNPQEVVSTIRDRCDVLLMGNHDDAMLNIPVGLNPMAAKAINCHRRALEPVPDDPPEKHEQWDFLLGLPEDHEEGDNYFVHASPRDKIWEYILPADSRSRPAKMAAIFAEVNAHCFVGHTHVPGIFLQGSPFMHVSELGYEYAFEKGEKVVVNISSVGQPRDRDPRACYALLTDEGVRWNRVEYDIDTTAAQIHENPLLDDRCGDRLRLGL